MTEDSFNLRDRLIRMGRVWYKAAAGAINLEVKAFKYRLPDQYFGAQDQRLFGCAAAINVNPDYFRDVDILTVIIGVSRPRLAHSGKTQSLNDVNWQNGSDCSCINHGISLVAANLIRREQSSANHDFIARIRELHFYSYLSHWRIHLLAIIRRRHTPTTSTRN